MTWFWRCPMSIKSFTRYFACILSPPDLTDYATRTLVTRDLSSRKGWRWKFPFITCIIQKSIFPIPKPSIQTGLPNNVLSVYINELIFLNTDGALRIRVISIPIHTFRSEEVPANAWDLDSPWNKWNWLSALWFINLHSSLMQKLWYSLLKFPQLMIWFPNKIIW